MAIMGTKLNYFANKEKIRLQIKSLLMQSNPFINLTFVI